MKKGGFAISLLVVAWTLSVGVCGQSATVSAEESAWFKPQPPVLELSPDRSPVPRSDYNQDCTPETGVVRPAGFIPPAASFTSEQTIEGCAVRGAGGRFMGAYYKRDGSRLYASLSENVRPIPGSTNVLRYISGNSQSSNAYLISNFVSLLKPVPLADGKLRYDIGLYTPFYLRDKNGSLLNIDHNSVSFSPSGVWMIASTFQGMMRFNVLTKELLLFDTSLNYQSGVGPFVNSAITNSGRYAVIASGPFSRLRIYDLENCPTINSATLGRKNCQFRELYGQLPPKTGDNVLLQEIRFLSDTAFRFYRREQTGTAIKYDHYLVLAPGTMAPHFEYLALGDSYTAGEGAYRYKFGTDNDTNRCRNSEIAYPLLIKANLQLLQADSVACAGATIWDIDNDEPDYKGQVKDGLALFQRDQPDILRSFMPGLLPQKHFVRNLLPDVVTVSIGGNDIGFGDKLRACLAPGTCFSSYEDRLEVFEEVRDVFNKLAETFTSLKASGRPSSRLFALGYPQIADPEGKCGLNVWLNSAEIAFSNELIQHINTTVALAAAKAGVGYIDVTRAFSGHRLCETVYSNIAVNGLTAGNDAIDWGVFKGPLAGESFHPNALGQRLYKDTILRQTNNLSLPPPGADSATQPDAPNDNHPLLQVPKTKRPVYQLHHEPGLTTEFVVRGTRILLKSSESTIFKPNTQLVVNLDSYQNVLTADSGGFLEADIELPATINIGFASLTVSGQNPAGESIRLYKTVFVAASNDDADGDGMTDGLDSCPVSSDHTDSDSDGIGDACDGLISEAPDTINTSTNQMSVVSANSPTNGGRRALSQPLAGLLDSRITRNRSPPGVKHSGERKTAHTLSFIKIARQKMIVLAGLSGLLGGIIVFLYRWRS